MKKTIILSEGPYGICATPIGRWDEGISKALQKCGDFSEIEINDGKGWLGSDISFLQEFRNILSLKIIKLNLDRIDFVNHLHNLKNLELITYANAAINFQNLPQLSSFSAIWSDSYRSIFGCHWIRNLFIDGYKGKDCNEFKEMKEMEDMAWVQVCNGSSQPIWQYAQMIHDTTANKRNPSVEIATYVS